MPTKKHRINLTVDDEMNTLFQELAELTGVPKTRLIMDFLKEAEPVFRTMKDGLLMANNSRDKLPLLLVDLASKANEHTAIMNKEVADLLAKQIDLDLNND